MTTTFTPFELKAAAIIAQARDLADSLEAMLIEVAQSRIESEATQAPQEVAVEASKKTVSKSNKKATGAAWTPHKNITELVETNTVEWNRDLKSITELRKYAFVTCRGVDGVAGAIAFQYMTQKAAKMNVQGRVAPNVLSVMEKDKSYVVYTSKVGGKSVWSQVIELDMQERDALRRARTIAAFFAELKLHGLVK